MYQKIKQLADEALAIQNKDRMDAALREISAMCEHFSARGRVFEAEMIHGTPPVTTPEVGDPALTVQINEHKPAKKGAAK